MAFIDKAKAGGENIILVDSGRLYPDPRSAGAAKKDKSEMLGRVYRKMGMTAVNVSDWELQHGVNFLKREAAKGLPLTSANLADLKGGLVFPNYRIKKVNGVRIGFFGLMRPELDRKLAEKEKITVKDPIAAARDTVKKMSRKADLIILLSDLGYQTDRQVAAKVGGIHFIMDSRDNFFSYPQKSENTFLLTSVKDGKGVGRLRLNIENTAKPFTEDETDRIRQQIRDLELNIQSFQNNPPKHVETDRMLVQMRNQRAQLQQKLTNPGPGKTETFFPGTALFWKPTSRKTGRFPNGSKKRGLKEISFASNETKNRQGPGAGIFDPCFEPAARRCFQSVRPAGHILDCTSS